MKKCTYSKCKKMFDVPIVTTVVKNGKIKSWSPSGVYLFHYQDTHGFPHEMMIEELTRLVESKMSDLEIDEYNKLMKNHKIVSSPELSTFDRRG